MPVAWPIWPTRREAERFRRGLHALGNWDRDTAVLKADVELWPRVRTLIKELEAARDGRRYRDYLLPTPNDHQLSAHPGGTTGGIAASTNRKETVTMNDDSNITGFLTPAEVEARDRLDAVRDGLADGARFGVTATYDELLDQSATAGGEDLVDKASLIGTDLIVPGWRWHEGIGTEGYVTVSCVVGETRPDAKTAKTRDENQAGPAPEPSSHVCFNDSGQGCARQLREIEAQAVRTGEKIPPLHFPRGLRVSKYQAGPQGAVRNGEAVSGGTKEAATYYFA
jgi:hypothetical protein